MTGLLLSLCLLSAPPTVRSEAPPILDRTVMAVEQPARSVYYPQNVPMGSGPTGPFRAPFAEQQPVQQPNTWQWIGDTGIGGWLVLAVVIGGLIAGAMGCELRVRWRMAGVVRRRRARRHEPAPRQPWYAARLLARNGHGDWLTETEREETKT